MFTLEIHVCISLLALVRDTSDETVHIVLFPVPGTTMITLDLCYILKWERDQVNWHKSSIPIGKTSQRMNSTDDVAVTQSFTFNHNSGYSLTST